MDETLFTFLWPCSFLAPAVLYAVSRRRIFGNLRGSALHPYNIVGFLLVVIALDFLDVHRRIAGGGSAFFATYMISNRNELVKGQSFFLLMSVCLAIGVLVASQKRRSQSQPTEDIGSKSRAAHTVLLISLAFSLYATIRIALQSLSRGSIFYMAGIRQIFLRDNLILLVFYAMLIPAFILFVSWNYSRPKLVALYFTFVVVLLLPLGSRGALLYAFIAVAVAICIVRVRLPVIVLYLSAPVVFLILVFTLFLRAHSGEDTFHQFLKSHGSDVLLGGPDYTVAEAMIVGLQPDLVPRYPFETVIGMIFAVVPRSLIPWKPEGPSAVFSNIVDPERWDMTKSEWVVTGFINLKLEFGVIGAAVIMTILAWFWARYLIRSSSKGNSRFITSSALCIVISVIFIRSDLYNLALFLWPTAIVFFGFHRISILKSRHRTRRGI